VSPPRDDRPPPSSWLERLERVRAAGDRRASLELAHILLEENAHPEAREALAETLCELEDPRCVPLLESALLDPDRDEAVRELALVVLDETPRDDPDGATIRRLASARDPLIRAYGLGFAGVAEAELVARGAADPDVRVRRAALEAMVTITRTPQLVRCALEAFGDEDETVRELACRVALFDEPLCAARSLLHAAEDPAATVRWAAMDALGEYPCVSVLLGLADLGRSAQDEAGPAADVALEAVAAAFLETFSKAGTAARRRLERWAAPALWVLESVAIEEAEGPEREEGDPQRAPVDIEHASRVLGDPDTPPATVRDLTLGSTWRKAGRRGLDLAEQCSESSTWLLRYGVVQPLFELGGHRALMRLAADPEPVISRAALARLLRLKEAGALDAARAHLDNPRARPIAGDEALAYVCAFGPPEEAQRAIISELERPDDRDGLFLGALDLVQRYGVRAAVPALLALVNAPVVGAVRSHILTLRRLRRFRHPRDRIDLTHLDGLDHLALQAELGAWGYRGGRYR